MISIGALIQGSLDPQTKIIPERDVYRLIMRSKLPSAEQFGKKSDRYFNFCSPILASKQYGTIILNEKGVRKTYTLYINNSTEG